MLGNQQSALRLTRPGWRTDHLEFPLEANFEMVFLEDLESGEMGFIPIMEAPRTAFLNTSRRLISISVDLIIGSATTKPHLSSGYSSDESSRPTPPRKHPSTRMYSFASLLAVTKIKVLYNPCTDFPDKVDVAFLGPVSSVPGSADSPGATTSLYRR